MAAQAVAPYPVRVEAELDEPSRWLWLVKWVLIVPHAIVLAFLWMAFFVLTLFAFFAILFTGRYPRSAFEFNVGVLRWSWRVAYYTYSALATDRYPPFTLDEVPDYPAHLTVAYPAHLSRGLVLVKWWLLAIPHYLIVALLVGGAWFVTASGLRVGSGLIGILVLIAAVTLAVTGRYPRSLYDLILGFNRWALRVAAYAGLMTDAYPPFRLDVGGREHPPSTLTVPVPGTPSAPAAGAWTGPRITALVVGIVLAFASFAALGAGVTGIAIDRTQRDAAGYLHTDMRPFTTSGYALTSQGATVRFDGPSLRFARGLLGDVRIRVRSQGGAPIFVGIGEASAVDGYLRGVERGVVADVGRGSRFTTVAGHAPDGPPGTQGLWTTSRTGTGTLSIPAPVRAGSWTLVVMNADASRGLTADVSVGAEAPHLAKIAAATLAIGIAMLAGAVVLMVVSINRKGPAGT